MKYKKALVLIVAIIIEVILLYFIANSDQYILSDNTILGMLTMLFVALLTIVNTALIAALSSSGQDNEGLGI